MASSSFEDACLQQHHPLRQLAEKLLVPCTKQVQNCLSAAKHFLDNAPWSNVPHPSFGPRQQKATSGLQLHQSFFDLGKILSPSPEGTSQKGSFFASISNSTLPTESNHRFNIALSSGRVSQKLDGIPVYAVCNESSEFVLISDSTNQKSLGIFCFRRTDAEALLEQVQAKEPIAGRDARVVAVSLNKVYELNAEGIAFRFLPDPQQVVNALQISGRYKEAGISFDGVPIFQSNNLIVRNKGDRLCPIFFCKEDLDQALQRASKVQYKSNPSVKVDTEILVGSFEHVVKRMEGHVNEEGWIDIVFIPPGMASLGQLENKTLG